MGEHHQGGMRGCIGHGLAGRQRHQRIVLAGDDERGRVGSTQNSGAVRAKRHATGGSRDRFRPLAGDHGLHGVRQFGERWNGCAPKAAWASWPARSPRCPWLSASKAVASRPCLASSVSAGAARVAQDEARYALRPALQKGKGHIAAHGEATEHGPLDALRIELLFQLVGKMLHGQHRWHSFSGFEGKEVGGQYVGYTFQSFHIRLPQGMVQWEAVEEEEVRLSVHGARIRRGSWRLTFHVRQ
jgi:hypothetical protein